FGANGRDALNSDAAADAVADLANEVTCRGGGTYDATTLALGFVRIANEMMARPIREITVARGHDVRDHALVAFGGAAGQHAAEIADLLGIRTVVVPANASVLSARGIAHAHQTRTATRSMLREWTEREAARIATEFDETAAPLVAELSDVGIARERIAVDRMLLLRTRGVDHAIDVEFGDDAAVRRRFAEAHREHFGFDPGAGALEIAAIRVVVRGTTDGQASTEGAAQVVGDKSAPEHTVDVRFEDGVWDTPVVAPASFDGEIRFGPALVVEQNTTTVVPPGWAYRHQASHLVLERKGSPLATAAERRDPVLLEVFNHLFMSVAEQMGAVLAATAHSANIRERHDFSCAVFDARGNLVANAPHIPVHLGAMGDTVRAIAEDRRGTWRPGDVYVTNNPYRGGSHLPDITAVTPIFAEGETDPAFFVASRGHHADIGGRTPGSFPPDATKLEDEGVILDGLLAVRGGVFLEDAVRATLLRGSHPARRIDERISDLRAQVAANARGERELRGLIARYGLGVVRAYMRHIQDNAAEAIEDALRVFVGDRGEYHARFADALDDGTPIAVAVTIRREREGEDAPVHAVIDFTGTGARHAGNLNAPLAVTRAAVLYVLRLLVTRDIPLNDGCWRPVSLVVPENSVLNPPPGAAVVGGNVETSQRVVDVLLGAMGVAAASQGTMNNLLFGAEGDESRPYYETIAGGSGATEIADGASAVQVHMTNTRITDIEVLEHRFPEVRVERFAIRRGSGGDGVRRGGDGVVRALRFLAPRLVTIFSERRTRAPFGLRGGGDGALGRNTLIR
ncbi:MAG: hydantoinase B/oxoprolinase family protein, partial [Deltaproteobacteria bacterium]|nr:hydantoinase B/oxoprolinase family protein [Deltaproteobacteria bacterium]